MSEDKMVPYQAPGALSTEAGGFGVEGIETLDRSDIIIPRKVILQATNQKDVDPAHIGQFYDNLTQLVVKAIDAVLIMVTKTRVKFSGDRSENKPECTSQDGVTGSVYGACAQCQFNPDVHTELWELKGPEAAARCNKGYNLLAADRADGDSMFIFTAIKTSANPAKPIITRFKMRRRPSFSAVTRFETNLVTEEGKKYYVLKLTPGPDLETQDVAKYREVYLSMKNVAIREVEDAAAEQAGGGDVPDDEIPF